MAGAGSVIARSLRGGTLTGKAAARVLNRAIEAAAAAAQDGAITIPDVDGLTTALAGKENVGVAASLDAAHVADTNPHPQYSTLTQLYAAVAEVSLNNQAQRRGWFLC